MNKATARHILRKKSWSEPEIVLAERILRHDGSRRKETVLPTLRRFAANQEEEERIAWARLIQMLETDETLIDALLALLSL